ncbi:hypothetical protein [Dyadobacter crusticola]|uniref:hypothetical protein n=1 Tax=Dyadobacter crusticola TaxID=292407 RepID=UPI0004E18157|nr:hypothetical protein [Dyadobacter crusticola]
MKKLLILIAGVGAIFSCQNNSIDKNEYISYKETITINDVPKATLTFFDYADGRCPEDVNCIWGGYALVDLELTGVTEQGRINEHVEMCLGECNFVRKDSTQAARVVNDTVVKSFGGQQYKLILSALEPGRTLDSVRQKEVRRIKLKVEKL